MEPVRDIAGLKERVQRRRLAKEPRPKHWLEELLGKLVKFGSMASLVLMVAAFAGAADSYPCTANEDLEAYQAITDVIVSAKSQSEFYGSEYMRDDLDEVEEVAWEVSKATYAVALASQKALEESVKERFGEELKPLVRLKVLARRERIAAYCGVAALLGVTPWFAWLPFLLVGLQRRRFPTRRQLDDIKISEKTILAEARTILEKENRAAVASLEDEFSRYRATASNLREAADVARRMAERNAADPEVVAIATRQAAEADRQTDVARKLEQKKFTELSARRLQLAEALDLQLDQLRLALIAGRDSETLDEVRQAASSRQRVAPVDYDDLGADIAARASALAEDEIDSLDDHATIIADLAARRRA